MNNKEKLVKHETYLRMLNNRKTSPIPESHKNHPESFKAFLENEIRLVSKKIDGLKLEVAGK